MTRSRYQKFLLAFGLVALWRTSVAQQASGDSGGFMWRWSNEVVTRQLSQCQSYGISIMPDVNNQNGTPPYYMIAWKVNGIPTVSNIGTDRENLSWTVNQESGSNLLLTVADSEELSGGAAGDVYTVTSGSGGDTSCLPPPPSINITLAANISTSEPLETCQPLGLRVYGGEKPYTISLQALGSAVVTNFTLGDDDDVLTYPNLSERDELIASVSDANGVWGTSTGLFNTTGDGVTEDTPRCDIVTTPGNSANVDQNPPQPSESKSNTTAIVVGVVVSVVVVVLLAVLGFFWRRRQKENSREAEPAFLPDAWVGPSFEDRGSDGGAPFCPYDPPPPSKMARYRDDVNSNSRTSDGVQGQGGIVMGNLSAGSASSPRRAGTFDTQTNGGDDGVKGGSRLPPGVSPGWAVEPDIIIQHRDGGAVQEIPPPYPSFVAEPEPSRAPPTSSPPAPGSSLPGGLAVADSSFAGSSRPSSAGGPSNGSGSGSGGSTASLISPPTPAPYKGKGRETSDLLS